MRARALQEVVHWGTSLETDYEIALLCLIFQILLGLKSQGLISLPVEPVPDHPILAPGPASWANIHVLSSPMTLTQ